MKRFWGAVGMTIDPIVGAGIGVAPGHEYTGGAGACSEVPDVGNDATIHMLLADSLLPGSSNEKILALMEVNRYVNDAHQKGKETLLDGFNTDRKNYMGYLGVAVYNNLISPEVGLLVYSLATKFNTIKQPRNPIDRASYNHDSSRGAVFWSSKAHESNARWMKNAWKGVRNPYDFMVAYTGTQIFGVANVISGLVGSLSREMSNFFSKSMKHRICGKKGNGCKVKP